MQNNYYDHYFQDYTAKSFDGALSWQWMKAMALAESGLDPEAVSPAGAVGVMQLIPGTSKWMAGKLGIMHSPLTPHLNIHMGVAFARYCFDIWKKETGVERIRFMLGSYNAGAGRILKAQHLADQDGLATDRWTSIATCLPQVTGRHARETITYVSRVEAYHKQLISEGESA
ncbi:transglycosylase SLT domain-containing protein [Desulfopila inferna]|uniref:transglycosylase SLT domain-containing protein n=1 Tax=Desulfopila inferna TaxID=468528 RepID=UPI00196237D4|nr:transglycosylase SLT domain-containing protein [Desulfopila inferna]MBM9605951.1 transglycosylase SLT domain-containing protein [Desulfopila inferna]